MKRTQEYKILPQIEGEGMYELEKPRSFCIPCLAAVTFVFILSGLVTLGISLWWSKQFHEVFDKYWPGHHIFDLNKNATLWEQFNSTLPADYKNNGTEETYDYSGELNGTTTETSVFNGSTTTTESINERNIGQKFAGAMREFEKQMETLSGIHQAELIIPLFMLVSFMSMLALIGFCCCIISKQREKRQRKLLAKVITDLQTGDKSFLLGNKEDDF